MLRSKKRIPRALVPLLDQIDGTEKDGKRRLRFWILMDFVFEIV